MLIQSALRSVVAILAMVPAVACVLAAEPYLENPLEDLRKVDDPAQMFKSYPKWREKLPEKPVGYYVASCKTLAGEELEYFVWAPKTYDAERAWPLIVILHGGGSGPSTNWAAHYLTTFTEFYGDKPYIVISVPAPINKGWYRKVNVEAVFAAMKDACKRFHIDRRRFYLYGHSMGGAGVFQFAHAVPKLFAAFAPNTAAGRVPPPAPEDMTGTAFILLNASGGKGLLRRGAAVEVHRFEGVGHSPPHEKTHPLMFEFFDKHTNDQTPDLEVQRQKYLEILEKYPTSPRAEKLFRSTVKESKGSGLFDESGVEIGCDRQLF